MGGKRYNASTSNVTTDRRAPARSAQVAADVIVPLLQAGITGALMGILFWDAKIALGVGFVAWIILLFDSRRLLWSLERVTGIDLDRSGTVGPPQLPQFITVDGDRARRNAGLDAAQKRVDATLRLVAIVDQRQRQNRGSGQKALRIFSDHILGDYKAMTEGSFDDFHAEVGEMLIANGLAQREGAGWRLTATPEDVREALRAS